MATIENAPYTSRARYYSSADGFNIGHAAVPPHVFLAERDRALASGAPTGAVALDLGPVLGVPSPATTPLVLARYVIVRAGETFATRFAASGEIHYVMRGTGATRFGDETVAWAAGDIFCLPGGYGVTHRANADAVLWTVTNEPALAFEGARAPAPGEAPIDAVHYPAAEIRRQLARVHRMTADMAGKAVMFGNPRLEATKTCLPSFTLALNSLPPRESQRAHRHNAVAVTLIVQGERCYSMLDGQRVDWQRDAVMITPPGAVHSHHNEGDELALFLIVQDGGLHYHTRTMGFSYAG